MRTCQSCHMPVVKEDVPITSVFGDPRPGFSRHTFVGGNFFMQRMLNFAQRSGLTVRLAYYPPYHSKYNPIERCWGILENHWNGAVLDTIDAVIQFAESMTWKGTHPLVELVTTRYQTGVKLSKAAMQALEAQITRLPGLERWFVDIRPRQAPVASG